MDSPSGRTRSIVTILLSAAFIAGLPAVPAVGGGQNDAGLGIDAGDTASTATTLAGFGTYQGWLAGGDKDWYQIPNLPGVARCYSTSSSSQLASRLLLEVDSGAITYSTATQNAAGGASVTAIAVPSASKLRVLREPLTSQPMGYGFTPAELSLPSTSAEDALSGLDAGGAIGSALAITPGCVAGRIAPARLGDVDDYYSIPMQAGQQLTYSFATTTSGTPLSLSLRDPSGSLVGTALTSGGLATYTAPTSGTYYLQTGATGVGFDEEGYFVGVVIGPPDPGNGCRPTC